MIEIRLDRVSRTFLPALHALDNVSLTVAPGECLAIVGPSGCGKTTLLRVIAGLEQPSSGHIYLGGACADNVPCHLRDIAMLFQRPALIPNQTVRQNLRWAWTLVAPLKSLFRADLTREQALVDMASTLGLPLDLRAVQELSGGEQQRVALGRCLLRSAKICLLDEPLGHLDAPLRTELRRLIRELARQQGMTLLHVTHDPAEAFAVGDRVAVMRAGRIVQCAEPRTLLHQPACRFVAELAHHDRGGLNLIEGHADKAFSAFTTPFGPWPTPVANSSPNDHFSSRPGKLGSQDETFHIIMGIGAEQVACSPEKPDRTGMIQVTLPVVRQEFSTSGSWVIGRDERGQLVGRASDGQRFEMGQAVTMMFSTMDSYGFDGATGQTLWTPAD